jgi:carbon-monoxide dehydrogenase small subunit
VETLTMRLNDEEVALEIMPDALLVDLLRDQLGLIGTKEACGEGECGACTVLLDGQPVASCLMPALKAQGREVYTVEGLASGGNLHPLQKSFVEHGAVQCGYCTPGMLMSAKALLDKNPHPTDDEIKEAISGNLCRCTGYVKIVEAIKAASSD